MEFSETNNEKLFCKNSAPFCGTKNEWFLPLISSE